MNHPLFGELRYDEDDQRWSGAVPLRQFAAFGEPMWEDETEQRREGILPLVINDPDGSGPSPPQEAAFRFLREHEADVLRAALGALFDSYKQYTASPVSGFWSWLGRKLGVKPIESPEGLAAAASFTGVELAREFRGETAYLLFGVNCGWEPEHGMMVVYHKDLPAFWTTPDALALESDPVTD